MKLMVIGFEAAVLEPSSPVSQRQVAYFKGYDVDILEMVPGAERHVQLNGTVTPQADHTITAHSFGGSNRWIAAWRTLINARRMLRSGNYDVLTVQDPFISGLVGVLARYGLPCRLHVQDHSAAFARPAHGLKEKMLRPFAKWIVRHADRVRTVSQRGWRGLVSSGIDTTRIDVVPVAFDVERYASLPQKEKRGAHIVCVSRLSHEKGLDVLLRAMPQVQKSIPDARLTIVGEGPERTLLEALADRLGIRSIVRFEGQQKDTAPYISDADVYVQPSRFEGWGIAVIEAAAAGKAIVMTDAGCAGEVIKDGESGLVVKPEDPEALAQAMIAVLTESSLAARLGEGARKAAASLPTSEMRVQAVRHSLDATASAGPRDVENELPLFWMSFAIRVVLFFIILFGVGAKGFELGDSSQYIGLAQSLLNGNGFSLDGAPFFYRTIGYPFFLASGMVIFRSITGFVFFQLILASFIPLLTLRLGKRLQLGRKASWIAALITAFEPHFVYYSVTVMTESVYTLLILAGCIFVLRAMDSKRVSDSVWAGVFFGIGMLTKPLLQFFPFILLILMLPWARKIQWRIALKHTLIILVVVGVLIFPWMYRNKKEFGTYSLSFQGPAAALFYLGTSIVSVRDHLTYQEAEKKVVSQFKEKYSTEMGEAEQSKAFSKEALTYIKTYPSIFLKLIAINTVTLWTSSNYNSFLNYYRLIPRVDHSVLPPTHYLAQGRMGDFFASFWKIFAQPFYAVGVLGRIIWVAITAFFLYGIIAMYRRIPERRFHLLFLIALCIYLTMTIWVDGLGIEARLRFPIMPIELLLAAYGWCVFRGGAAKKNRNGMKLLVVTQRVDADDTNLGAHVTWLRTIAGQVKQLTVIAQSVGMYDLPSNVRVLSLGKEKGASKFVQMMRLKWFEWREVPRHDAVLVLMVPMYVLTLGVLAWILRKPVYLWYTHKHVSRMLRAAMVFVRRVFTASKESFRLESPKVMVMGHAIDTDFFVEKSTFNSMSASLVSIGRISRTKRLDVCIRALAVLRSRGVGVRLRLVGDPISDEDKVYLAELHRLVDELKVKEFVSFEKGTNQAGVRDIYQSGIIALNASATGSLDKSILEAMSCGCLVVTSNEAFKSIVPDDAFVQVATPEAFAEAIEKQLQKSPSEGLEFRKKIVESHQLKVTLQKVVETVKGDVGVTIHSDLR